MIRHEDIGTNNPMRSVTPKVAQYLMSHLTFEPGDSVLGADRQEYEIVFVNGIHRRMVGIFSSRRRFDDGGLVFDGHAVRSDDRLDCCVQTNYFRRTGYARTVRPRVPACQETSLPGNDGPDTNRRARIPTGRVCTNITAAASGLSGDKPSGERWTRYDPEGPYPYGPGMHERPHPLPKPTVPNTSKHLKDLTKL